jgi:hypothetical protein
MMGSSGSILDRREIEPPPPSMPVTIITPSIVIHVHVDAQEDSPTTRKPLVRAQQVSARGFVKKPRILKGRRFYASGSASFLSSVCMRG